MKATLGGIGGEVLEAVSFPLVFYTLPNLLLGLLGQNSTGWVVYNRNVLFYNSGGKIDVLEGCFLGVPR